MQPTQRWAAVLMQRNECNICLPGTQLQELLLRSQASAARQASDGVEMATIVHDPSPRPLLLLTYVEPAATPVPSAITVRKKLTPTE